MNGDKKSGCTIITVDPDGWDTGYILRQNVVDVSITETYSTLSKRLLKLGSEQLLDTINDFDVIDREKYPQPFNADRRKAPKINPNVQGLINFDKFEAMKVWNYWRGLQKNGGIFGALETRSGKNRILNIIFNKIALFSEPNESLEVSGTGKSGEFLIDKKTGRLFVSCCDGKLIEILKITIAGRKKMMDNTAFINGYCKMDPLQWPKCISTPHS
jgi:methionyl-tRNA formyltransferase